MGFIETILIKDEIKNIEFHNLRLNKTRQYFYGLPPLDLRDYVELKPFSRVRVAYDREISKVEYFDLQKRKFQKFRLVYSDLEYSFKYENREALNNLKTTDCDEVIIIKNGLITDTTISNIAFFDGKRWITPKKPLLEGTKRAELIKKRILYPEDIEPKNIKKYQKMAMINAILEFYVIEDMVLV